MKPLGHALSALPFVITGHYAVAVGCFLPDAVWLINEYRFRRSGIKDWSVWLAKQPDSVLTPYRLCHSMGAPVIIAVLGAPGVALGYLIHLLLDLPTHRGKMAQQPLFPLSRWSWPERLTVWGNE